MRLPPSQELAKNISLAYLARSGSDSWTKYRSSLPTAPAYIPSRSDTQQYSPRSVDIDRESVLLSFLLYLIPSFILSVLEHYKHTIRKSASCVCSRPSRFCRTTAATCVPPYFSASFITSSLSLLSSCLISLFSCLSSSFSAFMFVTS